MVWGRWGARDVEREGTSTARAQDVEAACEGFLLQVVTTWTPRRPLIRLSPPRVLIV